MYGSQVGHMWVTPGMFCGSVGQMNQQAYVGPTHFQPCLAPLLFLLYMNDLSDCVCNKMKLYVRWCFTVFSYLFCRDCAHLQKYLNLLYQWFFTWLMDFNPLKCKFLRITNIRILLLLH